MEKQQTMQWQESLSSLEERLPRIDVTDRVMEAIRSKSGSGQRLESGRSPFRWRSGKALYVSFIAAAVIFACGFGYAAVSWKLFAPDGAVSLELISVSPNEVSIEPIGPDLRDMLHEGEAGIFYLRDQNRYIGLAHEREYGDLEFEQFAAETDLHAPLRELGDGFVFHQGTLMHDLNKFAHDLNWGNPGGDESVSLRKVPLGKTTGYSAVYRDSSGHQLTLSAWYNIPDRQIYSSELDKLIKEKVTIGEMEAFYLKDIDSDMQRMAWAEGEGELYVYYQLFDSAMDKLPRERFVEVAAAIVGQ
ncbi:hypothetical protein [Paenibacillus sp. PAMC21692]|uniref:hypothetical protein n=1 Tax=Paenibacillus sp. PAMC21692 TaxID=2762320 RepID=UPI00164E0324|nr:hypothetical protein [Paenibacillus sp. PAMC21692]QNK56929.1 hypothetical protein H7F31_31225 [Paenibacillus sp. PAMC21692]